MNYIDLQIMTNVKLPVYTAIKQRDVIAIKHLINHKNKYSETPVAKAENLKVIKKLVESRADVKSVLDYSFIVDTLKYAEKELAKYMMKKLLRRGKV
jgi:hypothetical protein